MSCATVTLRHATDGQARTWSVRSPVAGVREAWALVDRFDTGPLGARLRDFNAPRPEPKPTQLLSSTAERCLATLRPLAGACGLHIETAGFLAEGSDGNTVLSHVKELAAASDGVPVLCTHGDVIWAIVELLDAAGVPLAGPLDAKKGSIWVLETRSGSIPAARYIPPGKV